MKTTAARRPSQPTQRSSQLGQMAGDTFARLFEAVHEGVYIGLLVADATRRWPPTPTSS